MIETKLSFQYAIGLTFVAFFLTNCARNDPPAEVVINKEISPYYIVKEGDTITSIARDHSMTRSELVRLNELKPPYKVYQGQRLIINLLKGKKVESKKSKDGTAKTPLIQGKTSVADTGDVEVKTLDGAQGDNKSDLSGVALKSDSTLGESATTEGQAATQADLPASAGTLVWPVKGKILKPFGDASSGQKNEGINIEAPANSPVVATDNGVVAHVGNQIRGYGYVVLIKHASGKISVYGHLKSASVKANQSVKAGQEIGKVGTTGGVSQPQLHFELRQGKKALNPTDYLK